jgi:hypothetical protein
LRSAIRAPDPKLSKAEPHDKSFSGHASTDRQGGFRDSRRGAKIYASIAANPSPDAATASNDAFGDGHTLCLHQGRAHEIAGYVDLKRAMAT